MMTPAWRLHCTVHQSALHCFTLQKQARNMICVADVISLWKAEAKCDYDRWGHGQGCVIIKRECCYRTHVVRHVANRVLILYRCLPRDYHFINISYHTRIAVDRRTRPHLRYYPQQTVYNRMQKLHFSDYNALACDKSWNCWLPNLLSTKYVHSCSKDWSTLCFLSETNLLLEMLQWYIKITSTTVSILSKENIMNESFIYSRSHCFFRKLNTLQIFMRGVEVTMDLLLCHCLFITGHRIILLRNKNCRYLAK